MNTQNVLDLNQRIHHWMNAYHDVLERDITQWIKKHAIGGTDELARSFEKLAEEDRLLQIGVVGRVKAGKSSLLNALIFDGHNILPRAATPMTAALTTLTYAEAFGAHVEFYSAEDRENIRGYAERYEVRLEEEKVKAAEDLRQRRQSHEQTVEDEKFRRHVEKIAQRVVNLEDSLAAAHDQWRRINESSLDHATIDKLGKLQAKDAHSLSNQLLEYVGANGRFMPFTKSVDIFLPLESLRNIRIIDTPGLNDPVQSREERTSKLLKDCDVIFIVSLAGQFLSEQDLDVMSRITQKEGVQELVLIASQVDNQLYGSDTRQPTLRASLEKITQVLSEHMVDTLQRLKSQHPEIGVTFDSLIRHGAGRVLHTSGMCHSLSVRFGQKESWDDGELKAWENLQGSYQDFFTEDNEERCRANLDLLGNTVALKEVLETVRGQKDRIIELRRTELIRAKSSALEAFRADLLKFTKDKHQEVKNADIDHLKAQGRKMENLVAEAILHIDRALDECAGNFRKDLEQQLKKDMNSAYDETKDKFENATKEINESRTKIRDSAAARVADWLWGGGKEEYRHNEVKLFTTPVQSGLTEFAEGLAKKLRQTCKDLTKQFDLQLINEITPVARRHLGDEVDAALVISSVKGLVSKIEIPQFKLDSSELGALNGSGACLLDFEARKFLDDAQNLLYKFQDQAKRQINEFIHDVPDSLPDSFGAVFVLDIKARIKQLEGQVENALLTLDRLQRMAKELEAA